jgi:hypothetical protein
VKLKGIRLGAGLELTGFYLIYFLYTCHHIAVYTCHIIDGRHSGIRSYSNSIALFAPVSAQISRQEAIGTAIASYFGEFWDINFSKTWNFKNRQQGRR